MHTLLASGVDPVAKAKSHQEAQEILGMLKRDKALLNQRRKFEEIIQAG
jgi:hypothetical protein